jgi:hypothetical protein
VISITANDASPSGPKTPSQSQKSEKTKGGGESSGQEKPTENNRKGKKKLVTFPKNGIPGVDFVYLEVVKRHCA